MDVTGKTVTAGSMLSGTTALKNDGTDITGNIQNKSASDITNSVGSDNRLTVTAPAGYYSANATKTIQAASVTVGLNKGTASNHQITVSATKGLSSGYLNSTSQITTDSVSVSVSELVSGTLSITSSGTKDVTNYASASVAAGSATTPATTITANPSISVSSGGLITATASATKSVTPTVSAGFVSSGTSGTITVSGSNTSQLSTQAAQIIHPSTTDQTIASGKYLTGAQTIKGVLLTNLLATNIKKDVVVKVGDSTDDDCVTSITGTFEGQIPSGIKYIWTPVDGQGPWNVSGYASCAVDGIPINDNNGRIWVYLTDNLSVSINLTLYSSSAAGVVDWGDGNQGVWNSTNQDAVTHTYNSGGIYVIEFAQTSGTAGWAFNTNALGQASNNRNNTVIAVEHYTTSYLSSKSAFKYCNNLKRITYTGVTQTIAAGELDGSQSLEIVTFPSTVSQLGNYTFRNCTALREVHIAATTPPTLRTDVFLNTPSTMIIYVPYSSDHSVLSAYQTAWSSLAGQIQEDS